MRFPYISRLLKGNKTSFLEMREGEKILNIMLNSPNRRIEGTPKRIYERRAPGGARQRPSSANPKFRQSTAHESRAPGKPAKGGQNANQRNEEWNFLMSHDREDLASALGELKKEYRVMQDVVAQLRAENQRVENELLKQQRRIDKLVSPHINGQSVLDIRREIEKSILVRQLKGQINILRETIVEKDRSIEKHKISQKASNLVELTAEKEEYFLEIERLKALLDRKTEELQLERRRSAGTLKAAENQTETELRREIENLSAGYQELLARLTGPNGHVDGKPLVDRAPAPKPLFDSAPAPVPAPAPIPAKMKPSRFNAAAPSSPSKKLSSPKVAQPQSPVPSAEPPSSGLSSRKGGAEQFEEDTDVRPSVDGAPGAMESSIEGGFGLDAGEAIELDGDEGPGASGGGDILSMVGGDEVEMRALETQKETTHIVPIGTKVESRFRGGESFYSGSVKSHNEDGTYWIVYDDGDEEHRVLEENLRGHSFKKGSPKKAEVTRQSIDYADDFE